VIGGGFMEVRGWGLDLWKLGVGGWICLSVRRHKPLVYRFGVLVSRMRQV
jgi:hypothetical protein